MTHSILDPAGCAYFLGLDLGQKQDFTALAVLGRRRGADGKFTYELQRLHRFELGTAYTSIIERVIRLLDKPERKGSGVRPLHGCTLGLDATGVGAPVVDLFRAARPPCKLHPVTITAGQSATFSDGGWHVPKHHLVTTTAVLLESDRLRYNTRVPFAKELSEELSKFQVKVTPAGNEVFGAAWREGAHDDLVLACAIACWLGERQQLPSTSRPFAYGGMPPIVPTYGRGNGGFQL
jgi:hypothetical protein